MTNPLAWIAEMHMAHSLTLVQGLTGRDVLVRIGGEPESIRQPDDADEVGALRDEALENYWDFGALHGGVAGEWAFAFEPASTWAFDDERLAAASRGTRLIGCYNGDSLGFVEHWVDGKLITKFDTRQPELRHEQPGEDPDRLVPEMGRAGFLDPESTLSPNLRALALLHDCTGVALSPHQVTFGLMARLPAYDE